VKAAWVGDDGKNLPLRHRDTEKKKAGKSKVKSKTVKSKTAGRSTPTKRKAAGRARAAR
jgi:hypothetical protein